MQASALNVSMAKQDLPKSRAIFAVCLPCIPPPPKFFTTKNLKRPNRPCRDLTDLPAELLDEVLSLAFGVAPRYRNGYNDEGPLNIKYLSRLLLIN